MILGELSERDRDTERGRKESHCNMKLHDRHDDYNDRPWAAKWFGR